jgi:hypothetical protein
MIVSFYYSVLPFDPLRQKRGIIFIFNQECISKPVKWFLSQNGQRRSLLVFWPHSMFGQNHLSVKMLQTGIPLFRVCKSEEFMFPVSRPDDRAIPSGRPSVHCSIGPNDVSSRPDARQTSIIRPDKVFIPFGHFSSMSGRLPVLDQFLISFQVPKKGRSINRPDDVVSLLDMSLCKARIAIQIWPSGHLTAVVRTRVHQRRKFPIRLQPSGRLPIMVRTRALPIWKLRVEE